jgi:hypothetical protein
MASAVGAQRYRNEHPDDKLTEVWCYRRTKEKMAQERNVMFFDLVGCQKDPGAPQEV